MQQYKRKIQLIIGNGSNGLLIEELRIQFEINKGIDKQPNKATIKIYNLPKNDLKAMEAKYTEVILNAGYQSHVGNIFKGQISFWKSYKQGNDLITEITVEDGIKKYLHGKTNITLDKNTSDTEMIKIISGDATHIEPVQSTQRVRGRVISAPTRDILSNLSLKHDCDWSYQDNKLVFLSSGKTLNNAIVSLSYESGLLTEPQQTETGITVKCLLNPDLRIGSKIQLVNTTVIPFQNENKKKKAANNKVNHDGMYKIMKIKYTGDNYSTSSDFTNEIEIVSV